RRGRAVSVAERGVGCLAAPRLEFKPADLPAVAVREKARMRSQPTIWVHPSRPIPAAPLFPILESKLTPAPTRPGLVSRIQLLDWLDASAATPVVAICGAGGYGKTLPAGRWAKREPRRLCWLSHYT